jgi:hypothetical protein
VDADTHHPVPGPVPARLSQRRHETRRVEGDNFAPVVLPPAPAPVDFLSYRDSLTRGRDSTIPPWLTVHQQYAPGPAGHPGPSPSSGLDAQLIERGRPFHHPHPPITASQGVPQTACGPRVGPFVVCGARCPFLTLRSTDA